MYTFPNRLKITFLVLILVGAAGLVAGFLSAPSSVAEAQAMVADAHHGEGHGEIARNSLQRAAPPDS